MLIMLQLELLIILIRARGLLDVTFSDSAKIDKRGVGHGR